MNFDLNLSMREKVMLLVLGLVAIIFIGTKLLILPAAASLSADSANLVNVQLNAARAKAEVTQAAGTSSNLTKAYDEAKNAASPLLPSLDKPSLHVWIFGIAKKSGLTVQSATIGDPAAASPAVSNSVTDNSTATGAAGTASSATGGATNYNMKTYADAFAGKSPATSNKTSETTSGKAGTASSATGGDVLMAGVNLKMTGSYAGVKSFLDAIKNTKRYVVVSSLNCTAANASDNVFTCNVTLQCYAAQKLDDSDTIFDWKIADPAGKKDLM